MTLQERKDRAKEKCKKLKGKDGYQVALARLRDINHAILASKSND